MRLQYLGHSCFRIISQMGTAIICDPYNSQMVGINMPKLSCEVVTVSHHHDDHDYTDGVKGCPAVLDEEVHVMADDIDITSIPCFHDDQKGKLRGKNLAFCFNVDGIRVVHMGDIGERDASLAEKLKGTNVLLVPVGGKFTVDASGAKWYVDNICPDIVVPMHYKTPQHNFEIDGVEKFLQLFDKKQITFAHSETLQLEDVPQNDVPQVVVLDVYEDN